MNRYLPSKKIAAVLVAIILLILAFNLGVSAVNSMTSTRKPYITDTSCAERLVENPNGSGYVVADEKSCPREQKCYEIAEKYGGGHRCVRPGFAANYCGVFQIGLKALSAPPSLSCHRASLSKIIGRLPRAIDELAG